MSRIKMIEYDNASPDAKKEIDNQIKTHGRITNMKKTLLNHIPSFKVLMEWYTLRDEVAVVIGDFATNVFAHAISSANNCLICSTFFRKILKDNNKDPDNLQLNEMEKLLVEYGSACIAQPAFVNDDLYKRMRAKFSEKQIVMLTTFAGMMIATNLINNALDIELDSYLESYTKR